MFVWHWKFFSWLLAGCCQTVECLSRDTGVCVCVCVCVLEINGSHLPPPWPALTVNGIPNLDSLPKLSSGKETPISDIEIIRDDTP